jgi:M6 family metalloprotease-like protein
MPTGIFLQNTTTRSDWTFAPANPDGSLSVHLAPGDYQFDTVEPNGMAAPLLRHRYPVSVSASGTASLPGQHASAQGVYAVTLDPAILPATAKARQRQDALKALAAQPASTFKPASSCQLMDQVTPDRSFATDVSAGFPKVRIRLPSAGPIRALIVPVDFPKLRGQDNPFEFFAPIAGDMRDFYLKQSYGRVTFDFDILSHWVQLPFAPGTFGMTAVNGSGDFSAFRNEIIALTDTQIDYSLYDAVYFLVPKEVPMAQLGYGPAITTPTWTRTGYVVNGATGGADMYYNETLGVVGAKWKWMAHETGHAFGLYDEDQDHKSATFGSWGMMADSWSNKAIEHNGWDRYLQGWITEQQVACLAKPNLAGAGVTVKLSPLVRQDSSTKLAMVALSNSKILVIESRRNEGFDRLAADHEGLLVYTVDMTVGTLGGGYRTQRRTGSTDAKFEDAALHVGDTIAVEGVLVTVTGKDADGDTLRVKSVPQKFARPAGENDRMAP